ncbi:MAG: hypothetical protein K2K57_02815 [Oscillospiraceae bacterium]|nr:hypothetical protein [Oscillospiraceae bacterium]
MSKYIRASATLSVFAENDFLNAFCVRCVCYAMGRKDFVNDHPQSFFEVRGENY